jgi:hypothetical protein
MLTLVGKGGLHGDGGFFERLDIWSGYVREGYYGTMGEILELVESGQRVYYYENLLVWGLRSLPM